MKAVFWITIIVVVACVIGLIFHSLMRVDKTTERIIKLCIQKCEEAKSSGTNLDDGPCLGNPLENHTDWVCDVAHSPRQNVDNEPENQCSAYREGLAKHFVEVTPDCSFIRIG